LHIGDHFIPSGYEDVSRIAGKMALVVHGAVRLLDDIYY